MASCWSTKRAVLAHLAITIWFPGCLIAGWWQVHVALSGNSLSYLYSVEWPIFALFGLIVWWNVVHDDPGAVGARALLRHRNNSPLEPAKDETAPLGFVREASEEEPELAAYNAYLAQLATSGRRKTWRRQ